MTAVKSKAAKAQPEWRPFGRYMQHLQEELRVRTFATKGERTRFRLKLAAIEALEATGFNDLKVSDVCTGASVSQGTFYVYYPDKTAIASDVLLEFGEALHTHARLTARGSSDYEAILRTNQFFVSAYRLNAPLVRCLIQLEDQIPAFRDQWRNQRLLWIEKIAISITRRSGHPETPKNVGMQVAYALEGMVFQYLYEIFVRQEPLLSQYAGKPEHIADLLSVLWYRAVYCEDPPRSQVEHAQQVLALHRGAKSS